MADYYPLISRAVGGLNKHTGEIRRTLYARARSALGNQLRSVDPPLDESDIIREQLALEEAIREAEVEAAKRPRADAAEEANDRPRPSDNFSVPPRGPSPREKRRPSLFDGGLRGFRETVAEGLGGVGPELNRSARNVYEAVPNDRPPPDEPFVPGAGDLVFEPSAADEPIRPTPSHTFEVSQPRELPPAEPHDEPSWPQAPPPPSVPSHDDGDQADAPPARSYGRLIKIVLLLLIFAGVAGAAYSQRQTLTSLVASLRTYFEMDMLDLAIPIFGYGVIAFISSCLFLRRQFGIRS
jgi:hypothetical protein